MKDSFAKRSLRAPHLPKPPVVVKPSWSDKHPELAEAGIFILVMYGTICGALVTALIVVNMIHSIHRPKWEVHGSGWISIQPYTPPQLWEEPKSPYLEEHKL